MAKERQALLLLGYVLFSAGRLDRAEQVLTGLLRLSPEDGETERLLIAVRSRLGRQADVLAATAKQLAGTIPPPAEAVMHWLRAAALWELGRKDEVAESADKFLAWKSMAELEEAANS